MLGPPEKTLGRALAELALGAASPDDRLAPVPNLAERIMANVQRRERRLSLLSPGSNLLGTRSGIRIVFTEVVRAHKKVRRSSMWVAERATSSRKPTKRELRFAHS